MCEWPSEVWVVHGETQAKQQLGAAPQRLYALKGVNLRISIPGQEQRNQWLFVIVEQAEALIATRVIEESLMATSANANQ